MRWTLALVAALLLSGCASKGADPAAAGIPATDLAAGNVTQTMFPLLFAGGTREASIPISETFVASDACFFGFPDCVGNAERTYDLTPVVPADVPVEMAISLESPGDINVDFEFTDAQFIQVSEESNGGSESIDATVVRAATGTLTLVLTFQFPRPDSAQGFAVAGTVHTVTRSDVVPPLLPVAVQLGPGDVVNATGDGLEQFVAFAPNGQTLRAVQYPFSLQVPEDGPSGTWFLVADADEAVRMTGPNQTLSARLLQYTETEPVPVAANQATTFTMDVAGHPFQAGVVLESVDSVNGFFGVAEVMGAHTVTLVTPDNVQVLQDGDSGSGCLPWCAFNPIGSFEWPYESAFLDEHLRPGTFTATVEMSTANNVQTYAWAVSIRQDA
jgi:hypothetical protein